MEWKKKKVKYNVAQRYKIHEFKFNIHRSVHR